MNLSASLRRHWAWWAGMAVVVVGLLVIAGGSRSDTREGDDRLFEIAEQLKCLQCVGESVAASQAPLAEQFRSEIRDQVATGATDAEILDFFEERYGQQVLLDPPTRGLGALIWVLPVLVVGAAVVGLGLAFRRWRREPAGADGPVLDDAVEPSAPAGDVGAPTSGRWRLPVIVGAVVGFVALTAWLVVGGTDDRGTGELTGAATSADRLAACQQQARESPEGSIDCYDEILAEAPDDVVALTYRGWARVRAGDPGAARADLDRAVRIDPTYPDARVFRAVLATNVGDFANAAQELELFWANGPSEVAISVVRSEGLERKVYFGVISAPTRDCWQRAAASGGEGAIDQAFLDDLGACLDVVLAQDPGDADARLARALAHIGPDSADPGAARMLLEGLLAQDRSNADARALLVSLDIAAGNLEAAQDGLEELEQLPRGRAAFLIGDAPTLRAALDAARRASVPNPDGGG